MLHPAVVEWISESFQGLFLLVVKPLLHAKSICAAWQLSLNSEDSSTACRLRFINHFSFDLDSWWVLMKCLFQTGSDDPCCTGIVWLIALSAEHSTAMEHLSTQVRHCHVLASSWRSWHQVTTAMRIVVGQRLSDSSAMAKQAQISWLYTGRPTAALSQIDSWATLLLQHYHTNAGISTLRFGMSSGLEESFNGTTNGVHVLRRNGSGVTDCLKVYWTHDSSQILGITLCALW